MQTNQSIARHALIAIRSGGLHLRSHHPTLEDATHALAESIDTDPLTVMSAKFVFAANGNVRLWTSH